MNSLSEEEKMLFANYLFQVLSRPPCAEMAIYNCFTWELFAKHPLDSDDRLCQVEIPISIFFGDRDWMRRYGWEKVLEKNQFKEQSKFYEVPDSGHHLYFDNPEVFAKMIIEDLRTLEGKK